MTDKDVDKAILELDARVAWLEKQHEIDAENIAQLLKKRQRKDWSKVERNF